METVTNTAEEGIEKLTKKDVALWGGTKNMGRNETRYGLIYKPLNRKVVIQVLY